MTILEKIKFEEDWLSEVNLTKENIKIALAGIRATVLEQLRWIPCSERLPKKDGEYLLFGKVTDADENCIFIGEYDACSEKFGFWQEQFDRHTLGCLGSEFYEYESVIAWRPLPQPCSESGD